MIASSRPIVILGASRVNKMLRRSDYGEKVKSSSIIAQTEAFLKISE